MSEKDTIIRELYSTLEKAHYPEVAQTPYEQFETTILKEGTQRIDLLCWLLLESPGFNSAVLIKFKDNSSRNDKILKCYVQIGLCNDEKILMGQCPIENQLHFLSLLTSFVKALHFPGNELQKYDKDYKNDSLKVDITDLDSNILITIDTINKTETESTYETELINITKYLSNQEITDKSNANVMERNIKESIESLRCLKIENYDSVLQKFDSCFEEIIALPTENSQDIFGCCNDIAADLQKIHSSFSSIDTVLVNEAKIKNQSIPKMSETKVKPLTEAIKSNLVSIEQAHHMYSSNFEIDN